MFAMALEGYAPEHDYFVVAIRFFESLAQNQFRVLSIARKLFLVSADQAGWSFAQPVTIGVLADPSKNLAKGLLNIRMRLVVLMDLRPPQRMRKLPHIGH